VYQLIGRQLDPLAEILTTRVMLKTLTPRALFPQGLLKVENFPYGIFFVGFVPCFVHFVVQFRPRHPRIKKRKLSASISKI